VITDRIAALDTGLFTHVHTQTTDGDRRSLLALHHAIAARGASFSYLEIGSYVGGTLQVVIADPRCTRAVSIDPRPQWAKDARPEAEWEYPDNTTERMLDNLASVPGADLSKLETVEAGTDDLSPDRFAHADFCFVDGEHTYEAALRDARFCRTVMQNAGVIAFHDFKLVEGAILAFLREAPRPRRAYLLLHSVFVVELGVVPTLLTDPRISAQRTRLGRLLSHSARADTLLLATDLRRRELGH
jgi:hypothetical protein